MHVPLTLELEKMIADKVSTGRYETASEAVREGLRLLEERDRAKPGLMFFSTEALSNYRIFYREKSWGVEIIRVLHGSRHLERIFDD